MGLINVKLFIIFGLQQFVWIIWYKIKQSRSLRTSMPGLVDFEERSRAREIFHARIYAPVFSSLGIYNFKPLETNVTYILILLNQSYQTT